MKNLKELFKEIDKKFFFKLNFLEKRNPRFVITFSGIPASGKTTLSKILEKKYKGVRVNNDDLRKIIFNFAKNYNLTNQDNKIKQEIFKTSKNRDLLKTYFFSEHMIKTEVLLYRYQKWFLENYSFKNGLLILDSSVDRKYNLLLPLLIKKNFKIFIIKMPFNKELSLKREIKRNKDASFFLRNIDRWKRDYDDCNKYIKVDFIFKDNLKELFKEIDKRLKPIN